MKGKRPMVALRDTVAEEFYRGALPHCPVCLMLWTTCQQTKWMWDAEDRYVRVCRNGACRERQIESGYTKKPKRPKNGKHPRGGWRGEA